MQDCAGNGLNASNLVASIQQHSHETRERLPSVPSVVTLSVLDLRHHPPVLRIAAIR